MDEFSLIDELIVPRAGRRDDVVLGIGDDGAVLMPPPGEQLVVVADTLVEAVHFPVGFDPADLGYRAVAVNLSDLAAMGASPRWATLALTLPRAEPPWLTAFLQGMQSALAEHDVQLVGGDTTRGPLTITVQLLGSVPIGQALTRRGARPGDIICVSGTLGDAAAGLAVVQAGDPRTAVHEALYARFARPTARVALGQVLRGLANACIDVSDGLIADLGHVMRQSGVSAVVEVECLPLSAAVLAAHPADTARGFALTGGDDYELCFTLPADADLVAVSRAASGVAVTRIGVVASQGNEVCVLDAAGRRMPVEGSPGYRHF